MQGNYGDQPWNRPWSTKPASVSIFDPQNMAASASY
jgi:antirestriction protein ArdC